MTKALTRRQYKKTGFENNKLQKRLCRLAGKAIGDFNMIEEGDKIMVCVSGGKDSFCLLDILLILQSRAPIHFDILAVNLNQKQPGFPADILPRYFEEKGIPYHIEEEDTYSIVKQLIPEGKAGCSLCSRLRRGILYRLAGQLGVTKIALGHHRDDLIETFFLNLFFGSRLKSMPPKLLTDDGRHIVIRPLAYIKESDIERYAHIRQFPLIPCNFCGPYINQQRGQIKALMKEWEKRFPGRVDNIFSSLSSLVPSHLMDKKYFPFETLSVTNRGASENTHDAIPLQKREFDNLPFSEDL